MSYEGGGRNSKRNYDGNSFILVAEYTYAMYSISTLLGRGKGRNYRGESFTFYLTRW